MYFELVEEEKEEKQEPTLAELVETMAKDRGLKPYRKRSRWHNMEIVMCEGKRLARTKNRNKGRYHAFWVDDKLYKEYLAEGRKPVEV
tara:strand:- start:34 stop:297 length:264 start_codon:yes stop_codon:yes gene_type:complete